MKQLILSLILVSLLSACNLGTDQGAQVEVIITSMPEDVAVNTTVLVTQTATATTQTTNPVPTATRVQNVQTQPTRACTVRRELPTYRVQSGDTLTSIAIRYQTTASQLADDNCLADANIISVGMALHVPNVVPLVNTDVSLANTTAEDEVTSSTNTSGISASPTPTLLGIRGTLGMSPVIEAGNPNDWGDYVVEPGSTVMVNWTGIDPPFYYTVVATTFLYLDDATGDLVVIGYDNTIEDGFSVEWTVPEGVSGTIYATGRSENNEFFDSSDLHVREPAETVIVQAPCQVSITVSGDVYESTDLDSEVVASVLGGEVYVPLEAITTETGHVFYAIYYDEPESDSLGYLPEMNGNPFGDCPADAGFNMG